MEVGNDVHAVGPGYRAGDGEAVLDRFSHRVYGVHHRDHVFSAAEDLSGCDPKDQDDGCRNGDLLFLSTFFLFWFFFSAHQSFQFLIELIR